MAAVEAEGLVKVYRSRKSEVRALDCVDLEVQEGTVLGLLEHEFAERRLVRVGRRDHKP